MPLCKISRRWCHSRRNICLRTKKLTSNLHQCPYYRLTDDDMKLRAVSLRRLSFLYNIVYGRVSERIQYGNTMWRQSRNTPESGACEKVWLLPVNVRTSWWLQWPAIRAQSMRTRSNARVYRVRSKTPTKSTISQKQFSISLRNITQLFARLACVNSTNYCNNSVNSK